MSSFQNGILVQVRVLLAAKMTRIQVNVGYPLMKSLVKFVIGHLEKGGTKVKYVYLRKYETLKKSETLLPFEEVCCFLVAILIR